MTRKHTIHELENATNTSHQRREWWIERFGWIAILLTIGAALLGLLGPGPLSSKRITNADGSLAVEFNAVEHYEAPGALRIRAQLTGAEELRLVISRSFSDNVTAESIVPRPVSVEALDDDVIYTFSVSSSAPAAVMYRYRYDDFDVFDHRIAVDGGEPIAFRQYVLP